MQRNTAPTLSKVHPTSVWWIQSSVRWNWHDWMMQETDRMVQRISFLPLESYWNAKGWIVTSHLIFLCGRILPIVHSDSLLKQNVGGVLQTCCCHQEDYLWMLMPNVVVPDLNELKFDFTKSSTSHLSYFWHCVGTACTNCLLSPMQLQVLCWIEITLSHHLVI